MDKAQKIFQDMLKTVSTGDLKKIGEKLSKMNKGKIAEIWDQVMALWQFAKDPNAPWAGKAIAIAALLYLITPIDAVPDTIPVIGLVDDASIIAFAVDQLKSDLAKYLKTKN